MKTNTNRAYSKLFVFNKRSASVRVNLRQCHIHIVFRRATSNFRGQGSIPRKRELFIEDTARGLTSVLSLGVSEVFALQKRILPCEIFIHNPRGVLSTFLYGGSMSAISEPQILSHNFEGPQILSFKILRP